ncbi:hypothetical protein ACFQNE_07065 [Gordonia phosphorivorans]|uniref:DUF4307 domain-containing protein n=1 Tax=Gordonia phosphorivorans TaxID=1056982 RepID=A0ABV6H4C2_9ACTN
MNEQPGPSIEYFQPSGPYLPRNRWRRRSDRWVWVVSTVAAVVLAAAAITAVTVGSLRTDTFTATGRVAADCTTRTAVEAPSTDERSPVRILAAATGTLLAQTRLDRFSRERRGTEQVCFLGFQVQRLEVVDGGYLVQIGTLPDRIVTRTALRDGI